MQCKTHCYGNRVTQTHIIEETVSFHSSFMQPTQTMVSVSCELDRLQPLNWVTLAVKHGSGELMICVCFAGVRCLKMLQLL